MARIDFNKQERDDIADSLMMKICYMETGSPKMRRNEAIDAKSFESIKKTSLSDDRFIVSASDLIEKIVRASPGRAIDIEDKMMSALSECLEFRIAYTETGSKLRRHQVERFNSATGIDQSHKIRPMHALTSTQENLIQRLEDIKTKISDAEFGLVTESVRNSQQLRR